MGSDWDSNRARTKALRQSPAPVDVPRHRRLPKGGKKSRYHCFGKPEMLHEWVWARDRHYWLQTVTLEEAYARLADRQWGRPSTYARCTRCGRLEYGVWLATVEARP